MILIISVLLSVSYISIIELENHIDLVNVMSIESPKQKLNTLYSSGFV